MSGHTGPRSTGCRGWGLPGIPGQWHSRAGSLQLSVASLPLSSLWPWFTRVVKWTSSYACKHSFPI